MIIPLMISWRGFELFFKTGIPSVVFNTSFIIMVVAIAMGLLLNCVKNKTKYTLWVLIIEIIEYLFIVACSTIICRGRPAFEFERLEITPFWTYKAVLEHTPGVSVWDIVLNVVLFVPLGFLLKLLYPNLKLWKMVLIAIGCSMFIETNQYFFEKGIAQIDDVMHNVIGAMTGWGIAKLVQGAWLKFRG